MARVPEAARALRRLPLVLVLFAVVVLGTFLTSRCRCGGLYHSPERHRRCAVRNTDSRQRSGHSHRRPHRVPSRNAIVIGASHSHIASTWWHANASPADTDTAVRGLTEVSGGVRA